MAVPKQSLPINFAQGLDQKTDPNQIAPGKFARLKNTIFNKIKRLQKRFGFKKLTDLPDETTTSVTTFNGNLTAIGDSILAYSDGLKSWVNRGTYRPMSLDTLPLVRNSANQNQPDAQIAPNGLICTTYLNDTGAATSYKYVIQDSVTGQTVVAPTAIPIVAGTITNPPRVFLLSHYWVVVFTNRIAGSDFLKYVAINTNIPTSVTTIATISSAYTAASTGQNFDGVVANGLLYLAWNGNDGGGAVRMATLSPSFTLSAPKVFAGSVADLMSVSADTTQSTAVIYAAFYTDSSNKVYALAVSQSLVTILAATQIGNGITVTNITSSSQNGVTSDAACTVLVEVENNYSYDSGVPSHYVERLLVSQSGLPGTPTVILRSVGLGSKSFIFNEVVYFLAAYESPNQPTYFLSDSNGNVLAKLAYSNGGGYYTDGLPSVTVDDSLISIPYLRADLLQAVNKTQGDTTPAVFAQTGINLVKFDFDVNNVSNTEIATSLNLSGGFLWSYDGFELVENGFHVFPDSVEATWSATGGSIVAKPDGSTNTNAYFYKVTYEWTDNQGNIIRSAPSLPIGVTTTGSGTAGSITVNVPYLRLTLKTTNPVRIVIYRWSVEFQTYYRVSSISVPTLNVRTSDSVAYVDTQADASIIGNDILYTAGGVIENIGPPATDTMTLYKSREFLIDAEDRNLIWFSKQVIEATPVEFSDLLTLYIAPTIGSQGNTGPLTSLAPLDDKLILFKNNAIYYIVGTGPDNTGANNDFSDPVFVTSTVGCSNPKSIVFIPNGLMFQSDKGIWLLSRDLNTMYIGAPVEDFNFANVLSALNIPGTNQVRFTLDNGFTLMYDYFFDQWSTFENIPAISSTLYQGLHTYVNQFGQVLQEDQTSYLDGSKPVLISLTTGWMNLAGLQGYERAYFFYIIGNYLSPHKLKVSIAYDYNSSPQQVVMIEPDNFSPAYGEDSIYGGGSPYGGPSTLEQWRVFFEQQKCEAFQISIEEIYDPSMGVAAGAGLTLSGLNLVVGLKSTYPRLKASNAVG